jgi:hypothetical protein
MATASVPPVRAPGTRTTGPGESLADRWLALAAMGGAVGGALTGAVLGAEATSAYPVASGTLGTMLGSALVASGWWLLARWWEARVTGDRAGHECDHPTETDHPNAP